MASRQGVAGARPPAVSFRPSMTVLRCRLGPIMVALMSGEAGAVPQLSATDRLRWESLPEAGRDGFLAGRELLSRLLPSGLHIEAAQCPDCGRRHGAPQAAGWAIGLAHASEVVVAAVAPSNRVAALGIDVEPAGRAAGGLRDLMGGDDATLLRRWTLVEAVLKADGRGLRVDPARVDLDQGRGRIDDGPWFQLTEVTLAESWLVSLAWREAREVPVDRASG